MLKGRSKLSALKTLCSVLLAFLPSVIKVPLYRMLFGYRIGLGVRIGFGSVFVRVKRCRIGDHVRIGRFNLFCHIDELDVADHAHIGHVNLFRGGRKLAVGAYATILRLNVFNSMLQPDAVNPLDPVLELGAGVVVTTGHWLDFTDRIVIGAHTIIGGRGSTFWTHNRQRTRAITVGEHCYLGSEIRVAPGVEVPSRCIVALGTVLMGRFATADSLIAGNPAAVMRPLKQRDMFLVTRSTRNDIPHDLAPLSSADIRVETRR